MSNSDSPPLATRRAPKNGVLLFVLALLIVLAPVATGTGSAYTVEGLFDLVLIAGASAVTLEGQRRWAFLAFTGLTVALRWSALLAGGLSLDLASALSTVLWIAMALSIVVTEHFLQREVSVNMILGAIVAYLLAAVGFAYLYEMIELLQPGSFRGIPEGISPPELGDALLYFSLVSLTTLGYGDIVPVSGLARPVAALEGAFGVFYLAVMVARLVGVHIASQVQGEGHQ